MRVLFFLGYNSPFPGAAWTRIEHFAQRFKKNGHQVKVVGGFLSYRMTKPSKRTVKGIKVRNICPTIGLDRFFTFILDIVLSLFFLLPYYLFNRPDVVIMSSPPPASSIGSWIATRIVGAKTVIDFRDLNIEYNLNTYRSMIDGVNFNTFRKLFNSVIRKSDMSVTVTGGLRKYLEKYHVEDSILISNGADSSVFKPYGRAETRRRLGLKDDDFVLVFVGGAVAYYSINDVIEAMGKLEVEMRSKVKLLLVGDFTTYHGKTWLADVKTRIKNLGLRNRFLHIGSVNDKRELAKIISCCDVGVGTLMMTEHNKLMIGTALPTKFFEYSACGIPIICTAHENSLVSKLITENKIGLTNGINSENGILDSIKALYNDEELRMELGENGRKMILREYDRTTISNSFLAHVKGLM